MYEPANLLQIVALVGIVAVTVPIALYAIVPHTQAALPAQPLKGTAMQSGDLCSFGRAPVPAHFITHYRCDDYRDGTITDARTGEIVKRAPYNAPRGFER